MQKIKLLVPVFVIAALVLGACSVATSAVNLPATIFGTGNLANSSARAQIARSPLATETAVPNAPASLQAGGSEAVEAFQGVLENVYAQVNPSVVNVEVAIAATSTNGSQNTPFDFGNSNPLQEGLGSGFVWDTEGHIVTNNHVVDGADQIRVTFADGAAVDAELVAADPNSDLAVIQVDVPANELHPVTLANSSQVKVGQLAIAIGNPYGLSGTMTTGIISALSRSLPVDLDSAFGGTGATYSIPDIIQTDASINPGNSGGVLVDDQGQLIGVTTAIQSTTGANTGIGFVIPANIVKKFVPALIQNGKVEHSWMGISGITLAPDLAQEANLPEDQQGVLVVEVSSGSPAEKAGLQGGSQGSSTNGQSTPAGGDVITAIDGQAVTRFEDLVSYLFNQTEVGQTVELTVLRGGQQQTLELTLGAQPSQ